MLQFNYPGCNEFINYWLIPTRDESYNVLVAGLNQALYIVYNSCCAIACMSNSKRTSRP